MKPTHLLLVSVVLLNHSLAYAQTLPSSPTVAPQVSPLILISDVQFEGFGAFTSSQLATALTEKLNLQSGRQVAFSVLEDGRRRISDSYQDAGYPFVPEVKLTTSPDGKGGVHVRYTVDESAPLSQVAVSGVTVLKAKQLQDIFQPLTTSKRLTLPEYTQALTQLAQAYSADGATFRVQDVEATLRDGVLTLTVTEPHVALIDLDQLLLQTSPPLNTRQGSVLNVTALNDDARTLSNLLLKPVTWTAAPVAGGRIGQVTVTFAPVAGATGEPIQQVVVSGNTQITTADILKVLRLHKGDIATPQLAQQDFYAIQRLYDERGQALAATEDSLNFENGILTFRLREAKVAGYVFDWSGGKPLLDEQILRHLLPVPGSPVQRTALQKALAQIQNYDHVQVTTQNIRTDDPQRPEQLTFVLTFADKKRSAPISAGLSYSAQNGLGGESSFGTNNLFGTGQELNLTLGANASDVGQIFSGSVNYSVPWIDANFLDFAQHPTSLNLSAWSTASGNNTLYVKGSDGLPTTTDTGRQYTLRSTGARAELGRNLTDKLTATASVSVARTQTYLESYKSSDSSSVTTANRSLYQDDTTAGAEVPLGALTALSTVGLRYDSTDATNAPSFGVRATTIAGLGVGRQSDGTALSWAQLEGGVSTYRALGRTLSDGSSQDVLAGRINAGTILGTGGEGNVFSLGSGVVNTAYELRGTSTVLTGTNYVTSSAELRHKFGLDLGSFVTGVYGLAFVDAGSAWSSGTPSLTLAYGIGTQLNTSFLNLQLAYGRTTAGNGTFSVRVGTFW